jgi:hypothetical protein
MNAKDVSKLIAKSVEKLELERGKEIKVDFTLSGQFVAKKGEDFVQVVSFAVPYDKLLAVALSKLNDVTVDSIVKEALEMKDGSKDFKVIKAKAAQALREIKGESTKRMSGKVTLQSSILDVCVVDSCEYC